MTTLIITGLYILMVSTILLLPTNAYASTQSTEKEGFAIDNQTVLQACATVLAGVLIFLTIERKFERRFESDYKSELKRSMTLRERLENRIEQGKKALTSLTKLYEPGDYRLAEHKAHIDKDEQQLNSIKGRIEFLQGELNFNQETAEKYKKISDIEDAIILVTLILLSGCIVFMIVVNPNWVYYSYDYFKVSRLLFGMGFLFLLLRVYLSTIDFQSHSV